MKSIGFCAKLWYNENNRLYSVLKGLICVRLLAIDGNSILNRAYYGIRLLSNKQGIYTNAILGFLNIYLKMRDEVSPDCVAVAFDVSAPTFRHKEYDAYKAGRKGMPPELKMQFPILKELLTLIGLKIVECEGYEADDILGTLAKACTDTGNECVIATGDRDSYQLVNPLVTIRYATTKEAIRFDEAKILEDYGVTPPQLIEVKALMGDSSDNIPGVAGIGEKTALSLIREYGSIDALYSALDSNPDLALSASVKNKLTVSKEMAYRSRWLATIKTDAPVATDLAAYAIAPPQVQKATALLAELELFSVLERLKLKEGNSSVVAAPVQPTPEKTLPLKSITDLQELQAALSNDAVFHVMTDGDSGYLSDGEAVLFLPSKELLVAFCKHPCKKRTADAKPLYRYAMENGCTLENVVFDCTIAGYLLNPTATDYALERLCGEYKVTVQDGETAVLSQIATLPHLCKRLEIEITQNGMAHLLTDIELPLAEVLSSMELVGFAVDEDGIRAFGGTLTGDIARLEGEIHTLAGRSFNIGSPKQLGEVLFVDLALPTGKKTKSGFSTSAEVLDRLAGQHPIIPLILEYRKLTKLYSTYVEGLLRATGTDGRVHSSYRQTETRTGRISSTEPNMQNIPVRTELGRGMRRFFVAKKGNVLLDADYSQIELRVLASVANDQTMIDAFIAGADIHAITASQVFGLPLEMVTPDMRRAAKAVNFGIVYGIGAFSLSQDIGVSVAEADRYIKGYLSKYHGVANYMTKTIEDGKRDGYVTTLFGRRRYLPELAASNKQVQAFGQRAAMNTPIQGTAADIIKIAMVRIYKRLQQEGVDAHLILQVHDELIVEAAEQDKERAGAILAEEMQRAAQLAVPLVADVNTGATWYDAKG